MNEVRNVATFHNPFHVIRNGKIAKVHAIGDQEGKSPVYFLIDETGFSSWESVKECRTIDLNALPNNSELTRALQETAGSRR